jgi:sugar phosphate isomerase/epimerase
MKQIEMHVHTFGLRYQFRHRRDFDVFGFLDLAAEQGFTGVNISANGPGYRDLGGTSPAHFEAVRRALVDRDLRCELDTSDTTPAHLLTMLEVASAIGAEALRVYTRYRGTQDELEAWTIRDLRAIAPEAEARGITVVLENHEDFQGDAIARILSAVDRPAIRALYDYGNSQMVGEDPFAALSAMQPWITSVHAKDHVIVHDHEGRWVQGVPMGDGMLPIVEQTRRLYDGGLRRFCFENVWAYVAPLKATIVPSTPAFSLEHTHSRLDGNDLSPDAAVAGEWLAFERAWRWFRQALADDGFEIVRPLARA